MTGCCMETHGQDYKAVFELYPRRDRSTAPDGDPGGRKLDIVFFHGLQLGDPWSSCMCCTKEQDRAWEDAWKNSKGECWPRDSLPKDSSLRGTPVRVLSVSYNASMSGHVTGIFGRTPDSHNDISDALFHSLVSGWYVGTAPFVLVGHSYGGVVIKSLVVHCNKLYSTYQNVDASSFMRNLRGVVSYGVPHLGSDLAKYAIRANCILPLRLSKLVYSLRAFDRENGRLSSDFRAAIANRGFNGAGVKRFAFAEGRDTNGVMVVPVASAKWDHTDEEFMELFGTNHFSVCKPNSTSGEAYSMFVRFLRDKIIAVDPSLEGGTRPTPTAPPYRRV